MTAAARLMRAHRQPVHTCGWFCRWLAGGWESALVDRLSVLAVRLNRHPGYVDGASTARLRLVKCALEQIYHPIAAELERRAIQEMRR
jgi:hypothetical protein